MITQGVHSQKPEETLTGKIYVPGEETDDQVGMFGTCGNDPWRIPFKARYEPLNIGYMDPVVDNWNDAPLYFKEREAWHLNNDKIVLIPVTGSTYGLNSLSEIGFAVSSVLSSDVHRECIVYISRTMNIELEQDELQHKLSRNMRALMLEHLLVRGKSDKVHVVSSLDEMLELSIVLWNKMHSTASFKEKYC